MLTEEVANELEALHAIYGDDFERQAAASAWGNEKKQPVFTVAVTPTAPNGEIFASAKCKPTQNQSLAMNI